VAKTSTGYWIYRGFSRIYPLAIKVVGQLGNAKAKAWEEGRQESLWQHLERGLSTLPGRRIWFHAASLGEFEQARPVIEAFRAKYPTWGILLTFFSPSGYEVRKNYQGADLVTYLPADTPENAVRFLEVVRPDLALFVKYEFWPFYLLGLRERGIPAISFSAIFRPNQVFFQPYGRFMRAVLSTFSHIYTQDKASAKLLEQIGLQHVTSAGDTRFDRVIQIAKQAQKLPILDAFKNDDKLLVVGSAWPEDVAIVLQAVLKLPEGIRPKVVVALHELKQDQINNLDGFAGYKSIKYSEALPNTAKAADLLIVDNMGMLSAIYGYADIAWIGGAYGKGLHNILEAAVFGIPVLFGTPKYTKFKEAKDLLKANGAFTIATEFEAVKVIRQLLENDKLRQESGNVGLAYCHQNSGATNAVIFGISRFADQNV